MTTPNSCFTFAARSSQKQWRERRARMGTDSWVI